nr:hypothetical protein [Burkholderiaceae bacterium]
MDTRVLPATDSLNDDLPVVDAGLRFDNSFARLPATFYTRVAPTPLPAPYLVAQSDAAAALI